VVRTSVVLIRQGADSGCAGDADGLGGTRKKELMKSGILLGLRKEEDVFVVESPYAYSVPMKPLWCHGILTWYHQGIPRQHDGHMAKGKDCNPLVFCICP
jgi:hypothetical protein